MRRVTPLTLVLLLAAAQVAPAQAPTPPAPGAATDPNANKPRYVFPIPPGFEKITVGNHTAVAATADVPWVRQALTQIKPATRPTTMPSDLLKRLTDARAALVMQISGDLALPDAKPINDFLDTKLIDNLKKLDAIQVPVIFFVVTREKLRDLTRDGWGAPRYRYNKVADAASYDENVMISIERPMDDSPLPAFYNEKDPPEKRIENLAKGIAAFDAQLQTLVSQQSQTGIYNLFAQHVGETHFEPLKLKRDQQWFTLGTASFLASKYSALITNIPRNRWLMGVLYEDRTMMPSGGIDLLNPLSEASMKPGAAQYYLQAMRRKGTAAILKLIETGGEAAIPRTLAAIRAKPPADGKELVKMIQETTGVDLSTSLAPQ